MRSQDGRLAKALIAIATGDNSVSPAGSLPRGIAAGGQDVLGAGRLGADGHQLILRAGAGYLAIRSYLRDAVAPLVIARAGTFEADINATSCCMTEVDCGGGLKCLSAEDPCPGGKVTDPWLGGEVGPLLGSEVDLIERLGEIVERLAGEPSLDKSFIDTEMVTLRSRHDHRELLFAAEEDGSGWWFDWILRLSNGMSMHITLSTHSDRPAPVLQADAFEREAKGRRTRISVIATDTGERLLLPRMFVGG